MLMDFVNLIPLNWFRWEPIFVFLLFPIFTFAQVSFPNECQALRCSTAVNPDGVLDEECWRDAQKISNFTQRELYNGEPVTERTEVAVLYDDDYIYIGIWCFDSQPDNLTAKYMKRDFPYWEDDNFEVIFDTFLDKRNGYVFVINPNGARADVLITDEGNGFDIDWNGIWDAGVTRNEKGWFAEMKISLTSLKFKDGSQIIWGANFERNIRRKQEAAFWQGWSRNYDFEHVSHAGTMTGLSNLISYNPIELKPFATAGIQNSDDNQISSVTKLGGDVNYMLSPMLKLSLTANTDFAQVESDRAQINLSRFSLFYPEKRDFFLEGKNFFEFNFDDVNKVFYSRKIGLNQGDDIPIIGGIKLAGKEGSTNLGVLSLQTAESGGLPSTNSSVLRVKQDVLESSYIGAMATSKISSGYYNYTGGVDGVYRANDVFGDNVLMVGSSLSFSETKDSLGADNLAYDFSIIYPNDRISAAFLYTVIEKDFNPELGFLQRSNFRRAYLNWRYRIRPEGISWIERIDVLPFEVSSYWKEDSGELESVEAGLQFFSLQFKSGDIIEFAMLKAYDKPLEDFETIDGVIIESGTYEDTRYRAEFSSYQGRDFSIYLESEWGDYYSGRGLNLNSSLGYSLNRHFYLYLDCNQTYLKFTDKNADALNIGGHLEYSLNPKLSMRFYGQWNDQENTALLNFRLGWIPVVGSDFYLAFNQRVSTLDDISFGDFSILAKMIWRFEI
jgi:hypothetical protein